MLKVEATNRAIRLLVIFSLVYAILELNIVFLAPIITIVIPYKYMKYKEENKINDNKNILSNLFIFNIITFLVAIVITKKINLVILDLILNIFISFIYYKILCIFDNKKEDLYKNPELVYNKIHNKIDMLEKLYDQTKKLMENAKTEKEKTTIELKLNSIQYKIDETKRQLDILKNKVELENNKKS
ncbi:MAG: hypothetical protein RSD47_10610 [Romboutsia sp.]